MSRLVLLGPQRLRPTLSGVVADLGVDGAIATVTAGWQEAEDDDAELDRHLGRRARNLRLYHRLLEAFTADPELAAAWRQRQQRLRELQRLYRIRLEHAVTAIRELTRVEVADPGLRDAELEGAFAAVRELDAEHLQRIRDTARDFEARWRPSARPAIARHRREVEAVLAGCGAVAVAGGHVAVLLNRLRLLDVAPLVAERTVIAWSAGAMVLAERVVTFHDHPPQGPGVAQVLDAGLGLFTGLLAFPHAGRRLALDDPRRVELLARRFAPDRCAGLVEGSRLERDHSGAWLAHSGVLWLEADGGVTTDGETCG